MVLLAVFRFQFADAFQLRQPQLALDVQPQERDRQLDDLGQLVQLPARAVKNLPKFHLQPGTPGVAVLAPAVLGFESPGAHRHMLALTYLAHLPTSTASFPERYGTRTPKSSLQNAVGTQALGHVEAQCLQDPFLLGVGPSHPTELPCQVVRTGRKLVYRLLSWNPHLAIFFRLLGALRC